VVGREFLLNQRDGRSKGHERAVATRVPIRGLLRAVIALGAALLIIWPAPSRAAELLLRVGDLRVPARTVVHGNVIALGGTAYVDGTVEGNAVAVGGNVDVSGRVEGSVRAEGGNVLLRPTAVVDGQATAIGGQIRREAGSAVGGMPGRPVPAPGLRIPGFPFPPPWTRPAPVPPYWLPGPRISPSPLLNAVFRTLYLSALVCFIGIAWLLAVLFPGALSRLASALERAPVASFGAGLVGWVLSFLIPVLLILSVVGVALSFLVPVAVVVAALFGMTAVALVIGQRIRRFNLVQNVVAGAVLLAVTFSLPRLGGLLVFMAATLGLGAVVMALAEGRRPREMTPPSPAPPA
jgi:hypothetical protein